MSCSNVREVLYNYISAYVDNELSDTDRAAIEKHLEVCAYCANERFQIEQTKYRLNEEFAYTAPYDLKQSIKQKLTETSEAEVNLNNVSKNRFAWRWTYYILPPIATAVAAILIIFALLPEGPNPEALMEEEIVSAHVRSLMEDNLTHVEPQGTKSFKPWFNKRVDFIAQPKDLSTKGFKLVGGRLDYLNKHNAASIVYEKGDHIINLFIFPTKEANMASFKNFQNRGYSIVKWVNNGLEYCAISDMDVDALNQFAKVYRYGTSKIN